MMRLVSISAILEQNFKEWHTPSSLKLKKAHMSKSCIKSILIVYLFSMLKNCSTNSFSDGQIVTGKFYTGVLHHLKDIPQILIHPDIKDNSIVHYDNDTLSHITHRCRIFG